MQHINTKKEERYERILTEATRLFAEKGYEQTTVSDIVKACDMARGTFYLYFENLEQVLAAVFSKVMNLLWAEVMRINEDCTDEEHSLRTVITAIFDLLSEKKDLLTVFHCGGGQAFYEFKYRTIRDNLGKSVAGMVVEGQRRGKFRACSPELVSMMIASLIDEVAYTHLVLGQDGANRAAMIDELVNFICYGVSGAPHMNT